MKLPLEIEQAIANSEYDLAGYDSAYVKSDEMVNLRITLRLKVSMKSYHELNKCAEDNNITITNGYIS